MCDLKPLPTSSSLFTPALSRRCSYETLMDAADEVEFDVDDERRPAGLCYTSGTTGARTKGIGGRGHISYTLLTLPSSHLGMPKAVVYTHRSQYLHALSHLFADVTASKFFWVFG
jgi:fatty-acyl-CoA synthase